MKKRVAGGVGNAYLVGVMRTIYIYHIGRPSWHQARAGHSSAAVITAAHTREEHAAFLACYRERGEIIVWKTEAQETTATQKNGN
jgi:hypothetical protein